MSTPANQVTVPARQAFDLQCLIDSHRYPFVVIDSDFTIVAVNRAYLNAYGSDSQNAVGQPCYRVSHGNDRPCYFYGEECPHQRLFSEGVQHSCLHVHDNGRQGTHQVRITAFPLYSEDGQLFMGELLQPCAVAQCGCEQGESMVGASKAFSDCLEQLRLAASADAPVLVQGETGTGKELAAGFIHAQSPRSRKPFLTVDCTALTETLFEAEVFGHAKGAFTGSAGERPGLFDQADGGTLFLDEVGELPLSQQAKLLRVLETGQYRRVGGRRTRVVNVRIICATNRHLQEAVASGDFREDLYYRISCLNVRLPALRERIEDIPLLAECLLEGVSRSMLRSLVLTETAIGELGRFDYPGNIRELRNILMAAAAHARGNEIGADDIRHVIRQHAGQRQDSAAPATGHGTLKDMEAQQIQRLLAQHSGNRRKVALALGISERTLYRRLREYGLHAK